MPKGIRGMSLEERILDKVIVDTHSDCWHYNGAKNNIGYGMIRKSHKDGMVTAHKAMYELHNHMVVPDDFVVMHLCESYDCVNPNHLNMATRKDVSALMIKRGKNKFFGSNLGMKYKCCNHCNMFSSIAMIARWHDDNCKLKT